ncbi:MAG TPA: c-type cytochrome [Thermoanaerobaculia bacterium]
MRPIKLGYKAAILAAFLAFNCTAVQQQKSQPAANDDLHFHNLKVLPQNISRDDLIATMRRFNQALGVECNYCHVFRPGPDGRPQPDFPVDEKREKDAARVMIRMTQRINEGYISKIPDAHVEVTCWTCHRGEAQPAIVPSLPAPGQQPQPTQSNS